MKEVKIKVKELYSLKYLIAGAVYVVNEEKLTVTGLLQQDLKEGIKLKLDRILNSLELESEIIRKRIDSLKETGKSEQEIKDFLREIDEEDIYIQYIPIPFSLVEEYSFKDVNGKSCNYSLVYNKFFE